MDIPKQIFAVVLFLTALFSLLGPLLLTWTNFDLRRTLISSNYIHYKVWDEITYPFSNFNTSTVEVWEWIRNFNPHFTGHVITYPFWGQSILVIFKGSPGRLSTEASNTNMDWY